MKPRPYFIFYILTVIFTGIGIWISNRDGLSSSPYLFAFFFGWISVMSGIFHIVKKLEGK